MDPPGSDAIRTSYPVFLQKGSFFNLPDFLEQPATPSHRRWLEGQNPIATYVGDRLSGWADIAA
jgi:hypothetical protein